MASSAALPPNQNNHAAGVSGGEGYAANSGGSTAGRQPLTFWCHECDMSVTLLPSSSSSSSPPPLLCPECRGEFLEEMELPASPPPRHDQTLTLTLSLSDSDSDSDDPDDVDGIGDSPDGDDRRRRRRALNQSYLRRLIRQLTAGEGRSLPLPLPVRGPSPAPQASIDALPSVQISNPSLLCAVCKDEFPLHSNARQLPCSHLYHSDCIVPWLSLHNSCPVCRFRLPSVDSSAAPAAADHRRPRMSVRFGSFFDDDDDGDDGGGVLAIRTALHRIRRRHRQMLRARPSASAVGEASPTQMAQAETGSSGPATSGETVSSEWPVEGGGGSAGGRVDDEGDAVMSDIRVDLFD
ncbi:E3 ubiquitin-protein ligase RZF1-like [Phoenix dactylifera]|uniref:RING-type E3 ubiquitin transferase n=1 Tax=Phoenix dactylifera TaxID=42345 RepID=A0A8B8ZW22_PHODC|nr:E3 ubiquitin-protein ligase RZF1-like [Phoenix dactylifera]XP_038978490.1 E3 ubiquitin-protein ligase RZF1-like [Phoenix dactylifera]